MTEDEAKTKWCPHVRHTALPMSNGDAAVYDNRSCEVAFHVAGCCIASACMAWRWDADAWTLAFDDKGPLTRRKDYDEPQGYCGLAGRP
jgi:hypothetical protein